MAGPTWRNEIDASVGLQLSRMSTKAAARGLRVPALVQIGDFDRFAHVVDAQLAFLTRTV